MVTPSIIIDNFWDFLTFKRFISINVLTFLYYVGAVVMPLFSFYLIKKYLWIEYFPKKNYKIKLYFILSFIISFLCCELFWRVGFEAIIGYFQMIQVTKDV